MGTVHALRTILTTDTRIALRRESSTYCPLCEKLVKLTPYADAKKAFQLRGSELEGLIGSGRVHRLHNQRAEVMLCCESLSQYFENAPTQILDLGGLNMALAAHGR